MSSSGAGNLRAVDANSNRAREGIRCAEEYARFRLCDPSLTTELRALRHEVTRAVRSAWDSGELLRARDAGGDPGAAAPGEPAASEEELARRGIKRAEEALRVLEEHALLGRPEAAQAFARMRFRLYELEQRTFLPSAARVRLYVLVVPGLCRGDPVEVARACISGGADALQLRAKDLPDRELVALAKELGAITSETGTLLIVNDRLDVALASRADGVHLGQDDLSLADARAACGRRLLIGRSTHSVEQALEEEKEGADYLGFGPVFPTATKGYTEGLGLEALGRAAKALSVPWFAIGGVTRENVKDVVAAGASRVAVCGDVLSADDPAGACAGFREILSSG